MPGLIRYQKYKQHSGFTLLEISIVLAIIAVIIGSGLVLTTAYIQKRQLDETIAKMDSVEDALLKYSAAYDRIPCPADITLTPDNTNYGIEAGGAAGSTVPVGSGACAANGMSPQATYIASNGVSEGGVPTRALQLPDSYMLDGWGRRFRYAVDPSMTASNALPLPGGAVSCPLTSAITIYDSSDLNTRSTTAAYTLISPGANGHGGYTYNGAIHNANSVNADELTNCHCTSTGDADIYTANYVEKAPVIDNRNSYNNFDDIVTFKEPWQLQTPNNPLKTSINSCFYLAVASTAAPAYVTLFTFKNNTLTSQPISQQPTGSVWGLDFSPDNTTLAWAGYQTGSANEDWLYGVSSSGIVAASAFTSLSTDTTTVSDTKFSPDGNYFVYGGSEVNGCNANAASNDSIKMSYKNAGVWTAATTYTYPPNYIPSACTPYALQWWNFAWSPNSKTLYAAENNGNASSSPNHFVDVFTPSGATLSYANAQINTQNYGGSVASNSGGPLGLAVHPSGNYLAIGVYKAKLNAGSYYHPLVLAHIPTATSPTPIPPTTQIITGLQSYDANEISYNVAWSPDGNYLALALAETGFDAYQFNAATPGFIHATISGTCASARSVAFSKDGNYVAVGTTNTTTPLCIYSHSGTTFTLLNVNYTLPAGSVYGVVWSK